MKWALLLVGCLALGACSRNEPSASERCNSGDSGAPVDAVLLAFLSRARAAHHIADEREAAGDLAAAIAPLAALTSGPIPHSAGPVVAPEVREVLADTRARLADLHSRAGAYELALADIVAGLESASEPNYFRGHLLETEGLIEERQSKALETKDPASAAAARARAISFLEQAMAVQAGVINTAAPAAPGGPSGGTPANTSPSGTSGPSDGPKPPP